jgi:hypothetical protein
MNTIFKHHTQSKINVILNRRGVQECTMKSHCQHLEYKAQHEDKQNKKHNTTQKPVALANDIKVKLYFI